MYLVRIWLDDSHTMCSRFEFNNQADAIDYVSTSIECGDLGTEISIVRQEQEGY